MEVGASVKFVRHPVAKSARFFEVKTLNYEEKQEGISSKSLNETLNYGEKTTIAINK